MLTSYKPSNCVLRLIFVVNIKFPRTTYHTVVPSTEKLYCLNSGSTCEAHLNAGGDFALVSSLVRFSRLTRLSLSEKSQKRELLVV